MHKDGSRRPLRRCIGRAALAALLAGVALPVDAGLAGADTASAVAANTQPSPDDRSQDIVVNAPPMFRDLLPERELDEQGIESYGVSTIDDLLGEVQVELGDDSDEPLILVNGKRINDLDEIGALPVEALRNLQVLPRGSAVRLGGSAGQRVISLTLNRNVRSATLTAAPKIATEGAYRAARGEAILTRVAGETRANLALRARGESSVFEADRDILEPDPFRPYALGGNVIAASGLGEIDPLLSAAAGTLVTVVPVPTGASPALADFAQRANDLAVTGVGRFRTLRPETRNYDLNGTFATRLAPWLTSSATIRLSRATSDGERGLPGALFILAPTNPASVFSKPVGLAYYGAIPLRYRTTRTSGEANLTFDADLGKWSGNFNTKHSVSNDISRNDRQTRFGGIALDDSIDPFTSDLTRLIGIASSRVKSHVVTSLADLTLAGPAAALPAGPLQATIEASAQSDHLRGESSFASFGDRDVSRSAQSIRAAIDVPLTSRDKFAGAVGDLSADAEYGVIHYSDAGTLDRHSFGLTWQPRPLLRLRASIEQTKVPPPIQTLGGPVVTTPGVRAFDPLTGQTVDVTQISGGSAGLDPQTTKIKRVAALVRLVPRLNLQLNAEYTDTNRRDFVSSLPEASAAVMLAFPDRFVRDSNGVLTTIDLRPVNFEADHEKRLRWGLSMNVRLAGGAPVARSSGSGGRGPRPPTTYLQLTANHSMVFSDEIRIRPGLDPVDLLGGGAIGIGGGRLRHQIDGTAAITSGGIGARLGVTWRGASELQTRFVSGPDSLRFSPLLALNLRAFADLRRLLPASDWAKGLRLSLDVVNALDRRQSVRDSRGGTPLQYQPAYRDPLGRTIEIELRKVF